jgi:hypothetical protein
MAVEEVEYEELFEPPKTGFDKLPKDVKNSIQKISGKKTDEKTDNFVLTYLIFGAAGGAFAYTRRKKVLHGIGLGLVLAYIYTTLIDNDTKDLKKDDESEVQ